MGIKTILNEFIAYVGALQAFARRRLDPRFAG